MYLLIHLSKKHYKVRITIILNLKMMKLGNSLAVQWLGLSTFTARAQVQTLVGELRSHKPCCAAPPTPQKKDEEKA